MSLVLTVDSVFNNPDAPYLKIYDPIEDRNGSLFLWDAGKQSPTTLSRGTVIHNLLNEYGAGNEFEFTTGSSSVAPRADYIQTELTAKKGIHFIVSQSASVDLSSMSDHFYLQPTTQLAQKMLDSILTTNANLFVSIWTQHTRHVVKQDGLSGLAIWVANNTTNIVGMLQQNNTKFEGSAYKPTVVNTTSKLNLTSKQTTIVGSPNYYQFGVKDYNGVAPTINQRFKIGAGIISPYSGGVVANQALNTSPSYIVYRVYIEDLNLSGRTFAEVKAIDDAEHAKAFAVGGRFYGDTWSNPATLLP